MQFCEEQAHQQHSFRECKVSHPWFYWRNYQPFEWKDWEDLRSNRGNILRKGENLRQKFEWNHELKRLNHQLGLGNKKCWKIEHPKHSAEGGLLQIHSRFRRRFRFRHVFQGHLWQNRSLLFKFDKQNILLALYLADKAGQGNNSSSEGNRGRKFKRKVNDGTQDQTIREIKAKASGLRACLEDVVLARNIKIDDKFKIACDKGNPNCSPVFGLGWGAIEARERWLIWVKKDEQGNRRRFFQNQCTPYLQAID